MITAKWKEGFGSLFHGADAQTVAEEIYSIGSAPTTHDIVKKAEDESTELHKCFTWDNDKAAELWRLREARRIVQLLVIKEEVVPKERPEIRMFYKVDSKSSEGYKPTKIIVAEEDEYKKLLTIAARELKAFKSKYSMLTELAEIFELIDKL